MFVGTTTILAASATYTSGAAERARYDTVAGLVFSDQAGTLHVDQSIDGTHWDLDTSQAVVGGTGASFNVTLFGSFWRLRYVNGGSDQGSFRLGARTIAAGDS